jgi:hypothetical protein
MRQEGIVASLDGLSIRASLGAICIPLLVLATKLVHDLASSPAPHVVDVDRGPEDIPRWLFIVEVATFFLVPMLALTGAVTALLFFLATLYTGRPPWVRCLFLVVSATWAMLTAAYYLWVVVPAITTA